MAGGEGGWRLGDAPGGDLAFRKNRTLPFRYQARGGTKTLGVLGPASGGQNQNNQLRGDWERHNVLEGDSCPIGQPERHLLERKGV